MTAAWVAVMVPALVMVMAPGVRAPMLAMADSTKVESVAVMLAVELTVRDMLPPVIGLGVAALKRVTAA